MYYAASKILIWLIYPLSLSIMLIVIASLMRVLNKKILSYTFLLTGIIILYICSIKPTADILLLPLESKYVANEKNFLRGDAIVVLDGPGDRYIKGINLFFKKAAPLIIMSGFGSDYDGYISGSILMKRFAIDCGIPPEKIIIESESRNTRENALYTKQLLNSINAQKVILITSAFHMPRAYGVFKKIGVDVMPVSTDYITEDTHHRPVSKMKDLHYDLLSFIPDVEHLGHSTFAIKEYIGMIVYRLKGWI